METTSQTPRTDANADIEEHGPFSPAREMVHASFARQLETELNEWKDKAQDRAAEARIYMRERDEAKAGNAELLERLRERTESHLAASARDVQDNQRLRVENEAMRDAISHLYDMTEGYADGAPDASAHDKLCNEIAAKLQLFIKP